MTDHSVSSVERTDVKRFDMEIKVYKRYPLGNKRFNWKQKDYVLSTFSYLGNPDEEGERLVEIVDRATRNCKEAGFNMLEMGWTPHNKAWAAVDACEKYGIDIIFQDLSIMGGMQYRYLENKISREVAESVVNAFKDKKHMIGYYVWDEPITEEQLKEARRQMDILEELSPDSLLFTVTIPDYNSGGNPSDPNELPKQWENGLYEPNFRRFVEVMDPPVVSFDYYPVGNYFNVWGDHVFNYENQFDDTFLWCDLGLARKIAKEKKLPLWFYYQGCNLYKWTTHFTFPMVRCMMYAAALYGAKGLQHYEAWLSVIDSEGNKGKFFDEQKQIHSEFKALGNTLMALDSTAIYHSEDLLPGCEYMQGLKDNILDSEIFDGPLPRRCSIGEFCDEYGNLYAMILNRDYEKPLTHTFKFKGTHRVYEVSRVDGEQRVIAEKTDNITLTFEEGDAILLRIQKSDKAPFVCKYELAD